MVQRKKRVIKQRTEIKKEYFFYGIGTVLFISIILFYPKNESQSKSVKIDTVSQVTKQSVQIPVSKKRIRLPQIEIQNGCGVEGIASKFKPVLTKAKIDVIATGNYNDFAQKTSFILVHDKQTMNLAISLAKKLGLDQKNIHHDIKSSPLSELTLVLGSDYGKLNTKESIN